MENSSRNMVPTCDEYAMRSKALRVSPVRSVYHQCEDRVSGGLCASAQLRIAFMSAALELWRSACWPRGSQSVPAMSAGCPVMPMSRSCGPSSSRLHCTTRWKKGVPGKKQNWFLLSTQ